MSRGGAKREMVGYLLRKELEGGIVVGCPSNAERAEEAPVAYKDVDRMVVGVAGEEARLLPLRVLKG
jgi:tRNA-splicing ligase RtcB (3'-phosphate/5'-hydroxy nucleic acid ligase)